MSTDVPATTTTAPGQPDDQRALQEEIERTRERLGQTVEALMDKADVKARAKDEAAKLMGGLRARVILARHQATARGRHVRQRVASQTAGPRQQAASVSGSAQEAAQQVRQRATSAAASISQATPEPVKQAVGNAAATISQAAPEPVKQAVGNAAAAARRRGPLTVAFGAVVAGLLAWLLLRRRGQG